MNQYRIEIKDATGKVIATDEISGMTKRKAVDNYIECANRTNKHLPVGAKSIDAIKIGAWAKLNV